MRLVVCEAKRDCDLDDEPRWIGIVVVTRVKGSDIWFKPPPMRELRGDYEGRLPGRCWHFRLRPETMIELSMCDEGHTQTQIDDVEWLHNRNEIKEDDMNEDRTKRYVGVFPADGGDCIGYCIPVWDGEVSLETQIEQSIGKLELVPGNYVAVSQIGLAPKTKTLTNFTVRVAAAPLEVVL